MDQARALARAFLATDTDAALAAALVSDTPWIFQTDGAAFAAWRERVVSGTSLSASSVYVMGSAATGFSLVPEKAGRPFKPLRDAQGASDIDIAIVDHDLFVEVWETVVTFDRRRALQIAFDQRERIRSGIYWGHVNNRIVPRNTGPARLFRTLLSSAGRVQPLRGHPSSVRLYRRPDDLISYQVNSLRSLRRALS